MPQKLKGSSWRHLCIYAWKYETSSLNVNSDFLDWNEIFGKEDKILKVVFLFQKLCSTYKSFIWFMFCKYFHQSLYFLAGMFWRVKLFTFCLFMVKILCILKKKKITCQNIELKNIFLYFRSFIFPNFIDSMICLEINFVCYVRPGISSGSFSTGASNSTKAKKNFMI